jgi:hypothetical protein
MIIFLDRLISLWLYGLISKDIAISHFQYPMGERRRWEKSSSQEFLFTIRHEPKKGGTP